MSAPSPDEFLTLQIESLAHGGDGVGHHEGQVVFVAGALPGETVRAKVTERQSRFLRAGLETIETASDARRALDCAHETESGCGGCGFRHIADHAALPAKAHAAWQALQRISRRTWPEPQCSPSPHAQPRTRVRFHCDHGRIGLHARSSHRVVSIQNCSASAPSIVAGAAALEEAWRAARRTPRNLLIEQDGDRLFLTMSGAPLQTLKDRAQDALAVECFAGVRLDSDAGPLWLGTEWIESSCRPAGENRGEHDVLWRRPGAFAQANPVANEQLRQVLASTFAPAAPKTLVDLYAGSGNFSLPLTEFAAEVIAVENAPDSLEGLRRSIARASSEHSFHRAKVIEHDLRDALPGEIRPHAVDALILDPPRTGAKNLMLSIRDLAAPLMAYVSCAPACLARDVAALGDHYTIESLHAVDMFPRTPHLEMIAVLRRS